MIAKIGTPVIAVIILIPLLIPGAAYAGQVIKIEPYRWTGDGHFGATRPAK
jgi:hypothetical protein